MGISDWGWWISEGCLKVEGDTMKRKSALSTDHEMYERGFLPWRNGLDPPGGFEGRKGLKGRKGRSLNGKPAGLP